MARNKHPEITEARILDTAAKLFLEKGWEQTTIQDIVDELGDMTRGAFYHHFKSKDEIIDAVTTRMFWDRDPFQIIETKEGLNGLQKMKYALKLSLQQGDSMRLERRAVSVLQSPIYIGKQVLASIRTLAPYFEQYMEEGNSDGSTCVENPKQTAESLMMLLNVWFSPFIFSDTKGDYMKKYRHLRTMYDSIGLPVFDEELQKLFEKLYDKVSAL